MSYAFMILLDAHATTAKAKALFGGGSTREICAIPISAWLCLLKGQHALRRDARHMSKRHHPLCG